jgi:cysteine synthase
MTRFDSILDTIGRTPVVRIQRLAPAGVKLYVKCEAFNPLGSVKDRIALGIIEDAERSGALRPGQTVIEATSGNTGIGLAMVCAAKGYPLVVTMAENFSIERRRMMRFLGARVVLTPAALKGSGMLAKAAELAAAHGWFLCRQFENEANAEAHSRTTAQEILADFAGEHLDWWVTGCGTGGTLKGVAGVLRREWPQTRIAVCEPDNAPVLGSGIAQPRQQDGTPIGSHPLFRPHLMQGWSPDFIPKLTEDALVAQWIDRILPIDGNEALRCARELARQEGIFVGISSGATFAGALALANTMPEGGSILCMLPDSGERYLTTPLFEDIAIDMDEEEWSIARSTPGYRFDAPAAGSPSAPAAMPAASGEIEDLVEQLISDAQQPLVVFALEWCEFCWSVRKLFARAGIPYRMVGLDSVAYQQDDRGGQIRSALRTRTGRVTIPLVFLGGEFIGGCSETFDAYRSGQLQQKLTALGVPLEASATFDPDQLLPGWVHKR